MSKMFRKIQDKYSIRIKIIADKAPQALSFPFDFEAWDIQQEVNQLLDIDLGIMPLPNEEWAKGKCGFKALQYLSLGIPCVASPVGVNNKIVLNNKNGLWAESAHDWFVALETLLLDHRLRDRLGKAGRSHVVQCFSVESQKGVFMRDIERLLL